MKQKNEFAETILLHAARLIRLHMVKAALERKESDQFLEATNIKEQNIFHHDRHVRKKDISNDSCANE